MKLKNMFLLFLITFPCSSQENSLLEIDPRNWVENKITLSEIADDISYIPLDNSHPIVSSLPQINKNFMISYTLDGIVAFSRDGKLAGKIGNQGRGPGEYTMFRYFAVDDRTGTVYVMDRNSKIKVYSKNGNFLREISLREFEGDFDKVDFYDSKLFVSDFLLFGSAKYNWIILDTLGNLIKKKENSIPTFSSTSGLGGGTYKFGNKIYYWNFYNDTVFSILPDLSYKIAFLFGKGEHRWPRSKFDPDQQTQYMFPGFLFETNRFLVFQYYYKEMDAIALINKKSKETFLVYLVNKESGIMNDLDGGIMFRPKSGCYFMENEQEYMIGLVDPFILKKHIASSEFKNSVPKYPEKKKELEKLADSLKETDNPILMMVKLKK